MIGERRPVLKNDFSTTPETGDITSFDRSSAITYAILRFAAGTDKGDAAMLSSAFAKEAVIDFARAAASWDLVWSRCAAGCRSSASSQALQLIRSRAMSRPMFKLGFQRAEPHFEPWSTPLMLQGPMPVSALMMNWCQAELGTDQEVWLIEHLLIDNIRYEGDPRTMLRR